MARADTITRGTARSFAATAIAVALGLAALVCVLNASVDPFQQYRAPRLFAPRFYNAWQRFEDPGIARHYDYDRLVTGSSIMENALPADFDQLLGGRTVNLSESAQSAFDAARLLQVALATGKPREVLMTLDFNAFSGAPARSGFEQPFPDYLYDTHAWNDLPYLLGLESTRKSVETLLGLHWSRFNTDPARMWRWAEERTFSAKVAVHGLDPANLNGHFRQPPRTLEGMQRSFEANLAPLFESHPDVRFTLILPPYSILVWSDFRERGQLDVTLAFREWLLGRVAPLANVEVFDFQADPAIVMDLDNYTDIYHYSPGVTRRMIEAIAHGERRTTPRGVREADDWLRETTARVDPARLIGHASR